MKSGMMLAGVLLIRATAPDTIPGGGGLGRLAGFGVRAGWYLAVTVAMLYVANTARQVSTQRIVRLLGWMFVITTAFGVLAMLAPTLEFQSPLEMVLPHRVMSTNFVRTLIHPSLSSPDFSVDDHTSTTSSAPDDVTVNGNSSSSTLQPAASSVSTT